MDAINWLLITAANAFWWLWDLLVTVLGAAWSLLDTVLNPVLSPVLSVLNPVCTAVGDGVYAVLGLLPIWLGLTVVSAAAGVVLLVAFGYLSNQDAIGEVKDDVKAQLLALKLFKDDLRVTFVAQFRLLGAIARLQWYMLVPVLILVLPMMLALAQMGVRYQWRPLQVGDETLVTVKLADGFDSTANAELTCSSGIDVAAGPVPGGGEVVWRVRAVEPGTHTLQITVGEATLEKELVVGNHFQRVSPVRPGRSWTSQLLYPVEPALQRKLPAASVEVVYPGRESWIYGANYWVVYFFVVSMVVAIVLRPVFNVRF